ncbi:MAG: glucosamine-6-phosphate deaminase [Bacillota bacterium]
MLNRSYESLRVAVYPTRQEMGHAAATYVADRLRRLLSEQQRVRMAFAAAPSQTEFLAALVAETGIDWSRVVACHLDEYVGIPADHAASFGRWLDRHLFQRVGFGEVHYWNPQAPDPQAECDRYGALLAEGPLDMACIGIGENGHLAFNDPHVADFTTSRATSLVSLDETSRQQQVKDGCFPAVSEVPRQAWTMTIPVIMGARVLSVVVPGTNKAAAVRAALTGEVTTTCPASILRQHPNAVLFLDRDSYGLL